MFFNKKPKCKDIQYVKNVFHELNIAYIENSNFQLSEVEFVPQITSFELLKNYIEKIGKELNLKLQINESSAKEEIFNDLPETYFYEDLNGTINLFITQFGIRNFEITICEVILLFMSAKLNKDEKMSFDDSLIEDINGFYRPFLVCSAIYFGYGFHLLLRYFVKGDYYDEVEDLNYNYTYYVPLELNTIIYFQAMMLKQFKLSTKLKLDGILTKEIQKELNVCLKNM